MTWSEPFRGARAPPIPGLRILGAGRAQRDAALPAAQRLQADAHAAAAARMVRDRLD